MTLSTSLFARPSVRILAAIIGSAALSGLYARGGWPLGFVALVPWLRTLDVNRTLTATLFSAYAMSLAFTAAVFAWFGTAIGSYTEVGAAVGLAVLLLCAPLFQPQFLVFALLRRVVAGRYGPLFGVLAGVAGWVATERLVPRLFDDTLGYALYPSRLLRQAADIGGAPGLTVLLLLANESVAAAIARRADGLRAMTRPLVLAATVPLLLAGYGLFALSAGSEPAGRPLRMALIQSNLVNYEQERKEKGAYAVVRKVLDTHFALTHEAVVRQHADAVLWSETAYPTTFGHPKSASGAELDREIQGAVNSVGVPLVFGTYDRDADGEYNAAAFVEPGRGLLGFYRKTRLFPLTEYVPAWLDGEVFRRWLPWTGTWRPGNGARVFPLRLADGREVPVLASICLDDVDSGLIIDGARLGAQAILTMSNDSWFTDYRLGAEMHQLVAAFRSIETRLPQFRVTTNGYSAVIDATGTVIAGARMGERTLVVADVPVRTPPRTLIVIWGDWVGHAGTAFLMLLAAMAAMARFPALRTRGVEEIPAAAISATVPTRIAVLSPQARMAAGVLRVFARCGLLWMGATILFGAAFLQNTLAQIRFFTAVFLAPEAAAWGVLFLFAARASIENGLLVLTRRGRRFEIPVRDIAAVEPWLVPIPISGASLRLASNERWKFGLALADPAALARALAAPGGAPVGESMRSRAITYDRARLAMRRGRLDKPFAKFVLFSFALAIPAFLLHQNIAYGSALGEYYTFGLKAYLLGFALWWAAWGIGVVLGAAALRAAIEAGTLLAVLLRPGQAVGVRSWLERIGRAALYLGLPAWMLLNIVTA